MFEAEEVPFDEANAACQAKNSILVEARTEEINTIVKSYGGRIWMGATDEDEEGTWAWQSDNEVMTYNDWADKQPNDRFFFPGQDCLAMQGNGLWGDIKCERNRAYVCQVEKSELFVYNQLISYFVS